MLSSYKFLGASFIYQSSSSAPFSYLVPDTSPFGIKDLFWQMISASVTGTSSARNSQPPLPPPSPQLIVPWSQPEHLSQQYHLSHLLLLLAPKKTHEVLRFQGIESISSGLGLRYQHIEQHLWREKRPDPCLSHFPQDPCATALVVAS
jgi:hypothetical protein